MSNREIADLVEKRHDKTKLSIDRLADRGVIVRPPLGDEHFTDKMGRPRTEVVYWIGERNSYVIVAQLSPEFTARLVDRWQAFERGEVTPKALTPAEALLQVLQLQVDAERRQEEQARQIADIGSQVELIAATQPLAACPSNAESLNRIQKRFHKSHGLSKETVAGILLDSPYAPKPAGVVRNQHEDAATSTYTAFYTRQANASLKRFVAESIQVTATLWTHPFIDGRFAMKAEVAG